MTSNPIAPSTPIRNDKSILSFSLLEVNRRKEIDMEKLKNYRAALSEMKKGGAA